MRLIIIVTTPDYSLWQSSERWSGDGSFNQTLVRVGSVDADRIVLLCQADSKERSDDDARIDISAKTTPWLIEISNSPNYVIADVYVAAHLGFIDLDEVCNAITGGRLKAGAFFSHKSGRSGRNLFDHLVALIEKPDAHGFACTLDSILRNQVLTYAQRLSTLKHRLVNLFVPISLDLHGVRESEFDDGYMNGIVESHRLEKGPLKRARDLLYTTNRLSDYDNVEQVLDLAGLQEDENWAAIKSLLPRNEPQSDEEKREAALYVEAKTVIESLTNSQTLATLRAAPLVEDRFDDWCAQLNTRLAELVTKV